MAYFKFVLLLVLFCFLKKSFSEVEPTCETQWNLDYELSLNTEIPEALKILTEKTFKNYAIYVTNCTNGNLDQLVLDEQFVWDLRFDLYYNVYDSLENCRNCTKSLEEFRLCMIDMRSEMLAILDGWQDVIDLRLYEIKEEAEKDCVA